jgi:hypothetical protein
MFTISWWRPSPGSARSRHAAQDLDVAVLDVTAILAQVHGDLISARALGEQRGLDGIGIGAGGPGGPWRRGRR